MTTPNKVRRRQRIEIFLISVMLLGTFMYGKYDGDRDQDRRDCVVSTMEQLRDYQAARDKLTDKATVLRNEAEDLKVIRDDIQSDLIREVFEAQVRTEVTRAFVRFDRRDTRWTSAKADLDERIAQNFQERKKTRVPPFPSGRCDTEVAKELAAS